MPIFTYTALNDRGKKMRGTYQATSIGGVRNYLHQEGLTPVRIQQKQKESKISFQLPHIRSRYDLKEIVFFTRQFSTMMNAGLNVSEILDILKRQKIRPGFQKAISSLHAETNLGTSLTEAVRKNKAYFPSFLIRIIEVGELGGSLDAIMAQMADYYEREYAIRKKIRGALSYPVVIFLVTIAIMIFLVSFVLPNFIQLFEAQNVALPATTRFLLALSKSFSQNGIYYLALIFVMGFIFRSYAKSDQGTEKISRIKLKLPFFSKNYRMILTSRFARTMEILLKSGITITYALEITGGVLDNRSAQKSLLQVRDKINAGESLAPSLEEIHLFPDLLISMVNTGERSGSLDELLAKASDHYDREMQHAVEGLIRMIEPAAIILIAILVGFVMFSVLLPMLDMLQMF